jgi:arginyl-tRNA synthetase
MPRNRAGDGAALPVLTIRLEIRSMPTLHYHLDSAFRAAIAAAFDVEADPLIALSQNENFGDYQSNAAMGLAKVLSEKTGKKTNPRAIAEQIKSKLESGPMLCELASELSIAGPGFINIKLSPAWVNKSLSQAAADNRLGIEPAVEPRTVVIDYSGPNIAKEMHVGHLRSTILGDSFARTLAFLGHHVIRQNHVGDWGLQMGMVTFALEQEGAAGAQLGLGDLERIYKKISHAGKDPVVRRQMAERTRVLQGTQKDELLAWRRVRDLTLATAQQLYRRMGVLLDEADVRGESDYSDQYASMVDDLLRRGLARESDGAIGLFPSGFVNREGEPRAFIIRSRDGSYQYPTFDLAALTFRVFALHADQIIYTHDARQAEHFAMLFAVAQQLGLDHVDGRPVSFVFAPFGTVLGEDSKPLKSRSGENVKLAELLDEAEQRAMAVVSAKNSELPEATRHAIAHAVGIGAVKYADLSKDRTSDYLFSFDKMLALDGNTAPYLQYAHARIRSIFRKAVGQGAKPGALRLESPFELALAKHLLRVSDVIALVARELKPHHLCTYLYELSTRFSGFYENCPVLKSEEALRASRLTLCDVTGRTLALGLDLLGIEHPQEM